MRLRSGTVLMETIICMGIGSVLMLLAVKLLHQSFQHSRQTKSRFDVAIAQNRLARQFRTDAWSAIEAQANAEQVVFRSSDSATISYQNINGFVQRETQREGRPASFERYSLGAGTEARFEFDPASRCATLSIQSNVDEKDILEHTSEHSAAGAKFVVSSRVHRVGSATKPDKDPSLALPGKEQP